MTLSYANYTCSNSPYLIRAKVHIYPAGNYMFWVIYKSNMSNIDFACSVWPILWVPFVNCSLKLLNEKK